MFIAFRRRLSASFASCTLLLISHVKLDAPHFFSSFIRVNNELFAVCTVARHHRHRCRCDGCWMFVCQLWKRVNYSCLCRWCLLCNLQFCALTSRLLWVHSSGAVFASGVEWFTRTSYVQSIERKVVGLVSTFTTSIFQTFPISIPFFWLRASPSGGWIWWRRQLVCSHVSRKRPCWQSSAVGLDEKTIHKFVCLMLPEAFLEIAR